jgi:DNA-binding beta-propeller fold protein YncE
MTRNLPLRVSLVFLVTSVAYGHVADLPYSQVSRLPRVVDSGAFVQFAFDPVGRRLYAHSREGVYAIDVQAREPEATGPILPRTIASIEMAPDLGRLYFAREREQFGYLNLRTNQKTILAGPEWQGGWLVYEQTRRELYTPTRFRGETISVYDGDTGKRTAEIKLPGFQVTALESVPGKVFFSVANKAELYSIDAATHTVTPWRVNGQKITLPARLHGDPAGQYLFLGYDRHVLAVDPQSGNAIARLLTGGSPSFAFDPEKRLLVVSALEHPDHPRVRLHTYSIGPSGFTLVGELPNRQNEGWGLVSMYGGFLQQGYDSLLFWLAR